MRSSSDVLHRFYDLHTIVPVNTFVAPKTFDIYIYFIVFLVSKQSWNLVSTCRQHALTLFHEEPAYIKCAITCGCNFVDLSSTMGED